jgi:hypothetical protein
VKKKESVFELAIALESSRSNQRLDLSSVQSETKTLIKDGKLMINPQNTSS